MQQTIEFLRDIYGGFDGYGDDVFVISYLWNEEKGEPKRHAKTFRYRLSEVPNIDWGPHQKANREGWDIYFGSALRTPELFDRPGNSRGVVKDCTTSTCLTSDIDFYNPKAHKAEKLPSTLEEAACVIEKQPDPSIIVNSGYGVHIYHLYKEAVVLTSNQDRTQYGKDRKKAQSVFAKELKRNGWSHDTTWNVDRIWRLPGFLNWKVREEPKEVEVIYSSSNRYLQKSLIPSKTSSNKDPAPTIKLPEGTKPITYKPTSVDKLREALVAYQEKYHNDALAAAASADEDIKDSAEDIARRAYYIQQLLAGESIEEKGNRDVALTVLCGIICRLTPDTKEFTDEDYEYIVENLFKGSLQTWADDDEDTTLEREMGKALDKLRRMKAKDAENRTAGLLGLRKALNQFGKEEKPVDVEGTELPSSLTQQAGPEELTEAELLRFGLVVHGAFVYCWDWTKKRYFTRATKTNTDLRQVIRACWPEEDTTCPFMHSFINEEGRAVDMPFDHLFRQFGSTAEESFFSFLEPQTCYDHKNRSYIINPAPWRFTEARFDPEIDAWLKLLGGDENYDLLCDWLAGVTRLDRPCAALYLDGPPGCGKSLFAHGAAQIWAHRAPLYEQIVKSFNSALMKCPVILIDEGFVGTDVKNPTMLMRRLIAQDSHSVNVKFGPQLQLENHLRFIVAANNDTVFLTGKEERLSENDSRAMAERIAYVKIDEEARNFFIEHNRGNRLTNKWLGKEGYFARHILWLRENRDLSNSGRFLVEGKETKMHQQFVFQGNERNLMFEWIVRFSEAPAILNARAPKGIHAAEIGNGIVAVNTKMMKDNWKEFSFDNRDSLDHSHVLRHLKAMSHQESTIKVRVGGTTVRYWAIPIDLVLSYADSYDIGDLEQIKENSERDTEITKNIIQSKNYKDPESE